MGKLSLSDNRVEWADTEQQVEVVRMGDMIILHVERDITNTETELATIHIPYNEFLDLMLELDLKWGYVD